MVKGARPVSPGDVGVLVRTNRQAAVVQAALRRAGVPVVVAGAQSVLSTAAARDWLRLLEALEQPASRSRAVAVALTPFVGMSARQLVGADEDAWEGLHSRLHVWAAVLRSEGVAALLGHISASEGIPSRLLAEVDGERRLTDLGHVAELLHAEALRSQLGLAALRTWLARRTQEDSPEGADADQRSRRLDSGSEAVHILTVHRAKGLEFPIVYCPYLWDGAPAERFGAPVLFHDGDDDDQRKLDVGGDSSDPIYRRHFDAAQDERQGEDLRHLYVALTRAQHQAVIWWVAVQGCQHSALGRLLLSKGANGDVAAKGRPSEPKDNEVRARLERIAAAVPGLVSVETASGQVGRTWVPAGMSVLPAELRAAAFDRQLDQRWRRSSYSSLTAAAHDAASGARIVSTEPESLGTTDEPVGPVAAWDPDWLGQVDPGEVGRRAHPSLWATLPAGAEIGTFVHGVLEQVDFAAPNLGDEVSAVIGSRIGTYPGSPDDADAWAGRSKRLWGPSALWPAELASGTSGAPTGSTNWGSSFPWWEGTSPWAKSSRRTWRRC